ncbi:hypothetical protein BU16DRAFT_554302 [Lophium mytilinum]|uniref:Fungal N-terminal domain-containing protein n=1 Tax=Lophium mytilinum TaxID=390894 RepID=A0A6A6RER6_9PEZI|nr:hypothetical protein BU16DRAFT_554302 [Lophium mytilinum]
MDPLSIAGTAAGLATVVVRASAAIYTLLESTAAIDITISGLRAELSTLSSHEEEKHIWVTFENVENILEDCEFTLARLENALPEFGGRGLLGRGIFRKPIRAVKLNLHMEEITKMRREVGSCTTAMTMTLQMITICVSMDSGNSVDAVGVSLHAELVALQRQIGEVQARLAEPQSSPQRVTVESRSLSEIETKSTGTPRDRNSGPSSSAEGDHDSAVKLSGPQDNEQRTEHLVEHLRCAQAIFSAASKYVGSDAGTIRQGYVESNNSRYHGGVLLGSDGAQNQNEDVVLMSQAFGSVVGLDETRRRFIHRWIPGTVVEEDAAQYDDDEEDFETILYQVRYRRAQDALRQKKYADAESLLTNCITKRDAMDPSPSHDVDVIELKVQLAIASLGQGKAMEALQILGSLSTEDVKEAPPALHAYLLHSSAEVHVFLNEIPEAHLRCSSLQKETLQTARETVLRDC